MIKRLKSEFTRLKSFIINPILNYSINRKKLCKELIEPNFASYKPDQIIHNLQLDQEENKSRDPTFEDLIEIYDQQLNFFMNDQQIRNANSDLEQLFEKIALDGINNFYNLIEQKTEEIERDREREREETDNQIFRQLSNLWQEYYVNLGQLSLTEKQREFYFPIEIFYFRQLKQIFQMKTNLNNQIVNHKNVNVVISAKNLQTLKYGTWLNDEIVNGFIELINQYNEKFSNNKQILIMKSFIYNLLIDSDNAKILRISSKQKITCQINLIIMPLNPLNNHWSLMLIDRANRKLNYYDSYGFLSDRVLGKLRQIVRIWDSEYPVNDIQDESEYEFEQVASPRQSNGFDCGVFMLKNIQILSTGKTNDTLEYFSQDTIFYDRLQIGVSLLKGKIF